MTTRALTMLRDADAGRIEHPGGILLAHLIRVQALLTSWDARADLRSAGLCHAFYGTDGFPVALLDLEHRADLVHAIGADAEALVYFYAACDREVTYPTFADDGGMFLDRFTGHRFAPSLAERRDFAELTAANELDLVAISPEMRARHGASLQSLFTRWQALLSEPAWAHCRRLLA